MYFNKCHENFKTYIFIFTLNFYILMFIFYFASLVYQFQENLIMVQKIEQRNVLNLRQY